MPKLLIIFILFQHWECRALMVVMNYTVLTNHLWIFIEGLYLCNMIFRDVFSENNPVTNYIIFGWRKFIPIFFISVLMKFFTPFSCGFAFCFVLDMCQIFFRKLPVSFTTGRRGLHEVQLFNFLCCSKVLERSFHSLLLLDHQTPDGRHCGR